MSTQRVHVIVMAATVLTSASTLAAEVPRVVTDIAPVQGLAARVMDGLGTPVQIVGPGASPHGYALRPSEAEALAGAEAIFWVGPELTPWLGQTIDTIAPEADVTALLHAPGTSVMEFRAGPRFDHGGAGHDDGGGAGDDHAHGDEAGEEHGEDHGDHHGKEHGAEMMGGDTHDAHAHGGHDHSGEDPHAWLDPENGKAWLSAMAETLARIDPPNADAYAANAAEGRAEIDAAAQEVEAMLAPIMGARFVVFHDAYHYFEHHFGLAAAGAIAEGDASDPGPARIEEVRALIRDLSVTCVLSEPAFNPAFARTVIEGTGARSGVIDPLGGDITPGPDFYPALMRDVAARLVACAG
jgi:zinc transport system substrate-binding protein